MYIEYKKGGSIIKKIILSILYFTLLIPIYANASEGSLVKVGNKYYETFEEALANAGTNDTIALLSDVKLKETQNINKKININLNGNDVTAPERVFLVNGGNLNITGKGKIKEAKPNMGAIALIGSENPIDTDYSTVTIGENVLLEGWSGIFITHNNKKSYGVKVDFSGKINSLTDSEGVTGSGIYVNGNISDKNNHPVINIKDGAEITSTGVGLYIAGYSTFNIRKAKIDGIEAGIGIKAGVLNIDGAEVKSTGPDETPTEGYNNGIKASGTSIQIESNNGYPGNIEINIDSGTFTSKNSFVLYEYIGKGTSSQVTALDISGGTFTGKKEVITISNSLKEFHSKFISGGKYSSNPTEYLKSGFSASLENGLYVVSQGTIKTVSLLDEDENSSGKTILITAIISIILLSLIYINRRKILNLVR